MRDRLIELIENAVNGCARHWAEVIADYLLANGVVLLDFAVVTPENRLLITQIANMPLNDVCELIKAKQEGRIITPPCKVGDKIYIIDLFDYEPCKKSGKCGDVCPHLYAEYGFGYECKKSKYGEKPFSCAEIKTETIEDITQIFSYWTRFGQTVFLTKEEAEAKLKELGK